MTVLTSAGAIVSGLDRKMSYFFPLMHKITKAREIYEKFGLGQLAHVKFPGKKIILLLSLTKGGYYIEKQFENSYLISENYPRL